MLEPVIVINGVVLNNAQALAVRVAVNYFASLMSDPEYLGTDDTGHRITSNYRQRMFEVVNIMHGVGNKSTPPEDSEKTGEKYE